MEKWKKARGQGGINVDNLWKKINIKG